MVVKRPHERQDLKGHLHPVLPVQTEGYAHGRHPRFFEPRVLQCEGYGVARTRPLLPVVDVILRDCDFHGVLKMGCCRRHLGLSGSEEQLDDRSQPHTSARL